MTCELREGREADVFYLVCATGLFGSSWWRTAAAAAAGETEERWLQSVCRATRGWRWASSKAAPPSVLHQRADLRRGHCVVSPQTVWPLCEATTPLPPSCALSFSERRSSVLCHTLYFIYQMKILHLNEAVRFPCIITEGHIWSSTQMMLIHESKRNKRRILIHGSFASSSSCPSVLGFITALAHNQTKTHPRETSHWDVFLYWDCCMMNEWRYITKDFWGVCELYRTQNITVLAYYVRWVKEVFTITDFTHWFLDSFESFDHFWQCLPSKLLDKCLFNISYNTINWMLQLWGLHIVFQSYVTNHIHWNTVDRNI